jgi:hypothetical protein
MTEDPTDKTDPTYPKSTRGARGSGARGREQDVGGQQYTGPERRAQPRPAHIASGLPLWTTITVVLTLTGLLAYNIIVVGPEGLPTSYVLGGLLGAYAGVDQLLRRREESLDRRDRDEG